jgi:hypothetical protein
MVPEVYSSEKKAHLELSASVSDSISEDRRFFDIAFFKRNDKGAIVTGGTICC